MSTLDTLRRAEHLTNLCKRMGISIPTGYKKVRNYNGVGRSEGKFQ